MVSWSECSGGVDHLSILGGPDLNSPEITKLCGHTSNQHVSSIGNHMTVKFVGDSYEGSRKFFLLFYIC